MSTIKISELPIGTLTPTSVFPFVDGGTTYKGAISSITSNSTVEVTYSELVDKITGDTLNTGSYYIITDFRTCYDQPDYDSNRNPILTGNYKETAVDPIIVLAISSNTISTNAYQPSYPNDKIQYDWTFSATEITNGVAYGRITERIDEFNNRTDYDHRTIQFKRYTYIELNFENPHVGLMTVSPLSGSEMTVIGTNTNFNSLSVGQYVGFQNSDFRAYEIISIVSDEEMYISGLTSGSYFSVKMYIGNQQDDSLYYQNNITTGYSEYYTFDFNDVNINNYIGDFSNLYGWEEWDFLLANNVFHNRFTSNKFGDACFNNTFFDDCWNNNVGNYFYNNSTDDDFDGNLIGNFFRDNRITSNFQYNRIGENFESNYLVQSSFYRNNIMNYFSNNIIDGDDFQNNEIGSQFSNNFIVNGQFYKNDIGNGYNNNKLYRNFSGNLIGNAFNNNNLYCEFYDNVIGEYFNNNDLGDIENPYNYSFYENKVGVYFQNNNISGDTYSNIINDNFENNTIYNDFYDNQIFNEFKGNIIYDQFYLNKVDWGFSANEISGSCVYNTFGAYTLSNDFLGEFFANVCGGDFYSNVIGDGFGNNKIGNNFYGNTISQNCQNNEIGSYFENNIIAEGFGVGYGGSQKNYIGDNFQYNNIGEYFYNNRVGINFYGNTVGNYFQWNIIDTVINSQDFTTNLGNITAFTYTATGTGATDSIYTALTGLTNGDGVEATFDVEVSGGTVVGVSGSTQGKLYMCGNTITIFGSQIGGIDVSDDVVITVSGVSPKPSVYETYTCNIFERQGGSKRLSFYDESDILNITNINE